MSPASNTPKRRGVPWFYLRLKVGRRSLDLKFLPDWWWRRYCKTGDCAYGNLWCPNGCVELVDVDE